MVEELKLAIKVDDDAIEQSLLKQFSNAEKMANKVVLTFNNIDLDDKAIEAKFKEMQKIAGKNPIDLSIDKSSIEMLSAISKQLGNIFDIAKGKSIIDSSATISEIKKTVNALSLLEKASKMRNNGEITNYDSNDYNFSRKMLDNRRKEVEELQNQLNKFSGDKANSEFKSLQENLENLKVEFLALYSCIEDSFPDKINLTNGQGVNKRVKNLYSSIIQEELKETQKQAEQTSKALSKIADGNKSNISSDNSIVENQNKLKENKKLTDENISSLYEFIKLCQEQARVLGETNEELKERAAYFKDENISGKVSVGTHYAGNHDASILDGANSDIHSHFSKYASFSESDLFNLKEQLKNFMVMGTDELTHLDLSGINKEILQSIALRYDTAVKELNQQFLNNLSIKDNLKFTDVEDIPERIFEKAFEYAEQSSNIDYDYDKYDEFFESETKRIQEKLLKGASLNDVVNVASEDISKFKVDGVSDDIKQFREKFVDGIRGYLSNILLDNDVFNPDKLINLKEYNNGRNNALRSVLDDLGVGADRLKTIDISNLEEGYTSVLNVLGLVNNKQEEVIQTAKQVETNPPIKDVFQGEAEKPGMDTIASATEEAVQAKKDFATANEGVQSSIDGSKSPLQLEAELMDQIAKSAREAADAKKEFVEANKQVKNSADASNGSTKKDKYKDKSKVSEDEYSDSRFASIANKKLSDNGFTILGESVNTELVDGLVKVNAKIKTTEGTWKTFSAKIDADGNMFEQRFRTITKGVDKLETALENFGRETSPALTYQETLDKANEIRDKLQLGGEYSIKVNSNELVTITKKLSDVNSTATSVTQTFKSAEDAIQNFGQSASNSAEKTSIALKGVKEKNKEVKASADETVISVDKEISTLEKAGNRFESQAAGLGIKPDGQHQFSSWKKQLEDLNIKIAEYKSKVENLSKIDIADEEQIKKAKKEIEDLGNSIKETIAVMSKTSQSDRGWNQTQVDKLIQRMNDDLKKNSNYTKETKRNIQALIDELNNIPDRPLSEVFNDFSRFKREAHDAKREGKAFFEIFKEKVIYGGAAQLAGMFGFYDIINIGREAFETIKEYDNALTEMNKVSKESIETLKDFQKESFGLSDAIGTTASQIQNSTADFLRLGESFEQAKQSAQDANALFKVAEFDNIDEATEALVAMSQAYKELDKSQINDVLNYTGNNFSISTSELASALQRSAATLKVAGNDIYEATALVTAGNAVLQDAETVGSGKFMPKYIVICRYVYIPESSYIG